MIIDSSALMAIALDEPERAALYSAIDSAWVRKMSAASYVECAEVYFRKLHAEHGQAMLDEDLIDLGVTIVAVTAEQAFVAAEARRAYGKGRHPAALNYGDSFSYALAKVLGEPLLFKGNDFSQTDIESVLA
ncbi:type II toxin-antitoxin system VapC family toxin [Caulobacter sp. LjRoot300]|uniref:type II toxin-antitoxin system VapC family toxin n=1 Tax=Caulobacter sp. LjRoot300 TaxID=3342321 RepID=UPI003ED0846A